MASVEPRALAEWIRALGGEWGPSGREERVRTRIRRLIEGCCDEVREDELGNLFALRRGRGGPGARRLLFAAHMDEPGLMVTHVEEAGFLRAAAVGRLDLQSLAGQRFRFEDGTVATAAFEPAEPEGRGGEVRPERLYLDPGGAAGRRVGDMAVFDRTAEACGPQGARLSGKAMDDRAGCAVLVALLRRVEEGPHDVWAVFTAQEEVGGRGAHVAAFALEPDLAVVVDATAAGDTPKARGSAVCLGAGAAVLVKGGHFVSHAAVREALLRAADASGVPCQLDVDGTDGAGAGTIRSARGGVPTGGLGVPCRHGHTSAEVIDVGDAEACVDLAVALVRGL